jgi:bifunctional enzyme CysN/CysC
MLVARKGQGPLTDIEAFLARHEQKELVRFVTVGSVDDGKSTLIGRLLHDTQGLYEDQVAAVRRASKDGEIDFSLFTDGLRAEREQGITIDVAYRYFSTETRKFIIADTPGHVQYTRNMATGASTADMAVILLDARLGVLAQSRRHAYIASLLGIPRLLVAVNKMDLVDYEEDVFLAHRAQFTSFVEKLGFEGVHFIPISAKTGDNVVSPSEKMTWFSGGTVLDHLEEVPVARDRSGEAFRFPVQLVLRPNLDYRGFAGQIASGVVRPGDAVTILPSGTTTRVKAVDTFEGELEAGFAPQSVTLRLEDEVDVSRGEMIAPSTDLPITACRFDAMLVWMSEDAFDPKRALLLKHTTRMVPAQIERIRSKADLETLSPLPGDGLALNDIGHVTLNASRPIFCDPYRRNRATGAFILIDALTNDTVAAGMIKEAEAYSEAAERLGTGPVTATERHARLGQRGAVVWAAGEAAATAAYAIERTLFDRGRVAMVVEADSLGGEALREVVVRAVRTGLVVVVANAADVARAEIDAALGNGRSLDAGEADENDGARIVDALESGGLLSALGVAGR